MVEQVADDDRFPVRWEIRENIGEARVVCERTVAYEKHGGHGSELFGAGSEAKICSGVDFCARVEVAETIATLEDGAVILADEQREPRGVRFRDGREGGVDQTRYWCTIRW